MEQQNKDNVYDQFRFLSQEELEKVNGTHLIGSKFLKSYLHGFIIKAKLYAKLVAQAQPFDLQKYKEERLRKRLEKELNDKIYVKGERSVKGMGKGDLNRKYIEMMQQRSLKRQKKEEKEGDDFEAFLNDPRFGKLKTDQDFEVDEGNEEFLLRNPSLRKGIRKRKR